MISRTGPFLRNRALRSIAIWVTFAGAVASAGTFGRVVSIGGQAADLALDEARGVLYVANYTANRVEIVSLKDGRLGSPIRVPSQPNTIDISPDGKYLLVGHYGNFEQPLSPENAVTLVNLATKGWQSFPMGEPVLGVGFGSDGYAVIVTGANLLRFDPATGNTEEIETLEEVNAQTLPVEIGKAPPDITEASLGVSADRNVIYGMAGHDKTITFKYDVRSRTVRPGGVVLSEGTLGPRVVSLSHNGARTFVGWVMVDQYGHFSNFFKYVTNEFSIGTTAFDDRRNRIYAQMPREKGEMPTLMVADGDSLAVLERFQLAENLTGKSLLSSDANVLYSLSASGVTIFPIGSLQTQHRVQATVEDLVFRGNFCDSRFAAQTIQIANPGGGATDFSVTTSTSGITISPSHGVTPASVTVTVDPAAFRNVKGTLTATLQINSAAAVNVVPPVRLLINNREPDQRGTILNLPGVLSDIMADPAHDRLYILRQDTNQLLVLDGSTFRTIATLKTFNSPTSLAITPDKRFLLVGHESSQVAAVFDLETLQSLPYVSVASGSGNVAHHIAASSNAILAATTDYQGKGHIIQLDVTTGNSTQLDSLGVYRNEIDPVTAAVASPDGRSIFFPSSDGNTLLFDDDTASFVASRKDFEELKGAYAASDRGTFVVGDHFLNSSIVPVEDFDALLGETKGFGFLPQGAVRATSLGDSAPGGFHRVDFANGGSAVTRPTRTIEAPGNGPAGGVFTRTVAVLSNGRYYAALSESGLTIFPSDYDSTIAKPVIQSAVSAADLTSGLAPGSLVTLFGTNLSPVALANKDLPVPTVLGDSCMTLDGNPVPLLFVSPTQINAQLLYTSGDGSTVVLRTPGGVSDPVTLKVSPAAPKVFRQSLGAVGSVPSIIREKNGQLVTMSNPVHRGDRLFIYTAGLGITSPLSPAGRPAPSDPVAAVDLTPNVTIGGVTLMVDSAALVPGQVGVYEINARVPFGVPLGVSVPLEVSQSAASTTVPVRVVD